LYIPVLVQVARTVPVSDYIPSRILKAARWVDTLPQCPLIASVTSKTGWTLTSEAPYRVKNEGPTETISYPMWMAIGKVGTTKIRNKL
jgi:hypothetical protein